MTTTTTSQTWKILTNVQYDNDDNDHIGTTVDYETYWNDETYGPRDWSNAGTLIDSETDENGRFTMMLFERFDTEFDRNAGESYPVYVTTMVTREEGEPPY